MRYLAHVLIRFYQIVLSPDTGFFSALFPYRFCKYEPSCSEYARQSICKHGIVHGTGKGMARILRCNPLSKGGYDPVK